MTPGKMHLLVLHFPIALICAAILADLLWLITKKEFFKSAGCFCIVLGAIAAIPAVITGLLLFDAMGLEDAGKAGAAIADLAEDHEGLGIATLSVALSAAVLRLFLRGVFGKLWPYIYAVLIVAAFALVSFTGHYGGMLAFGRNYLSH